MRNPRSVVALLLVAGSLLGAAAAGAEDRGLSFGDVPYGSSPDAVLKAMKTQGLDPLEPSDAEDLFPQDQRFLGLVHGQAALVTTYFDAAGHLEKTLVSFLTPDESCVPFFRALKNMMLLKHGKAVLEAERWDFPYDKGGQVGQEHIAIRVGKGVLVAVWDLQDAGTTDGGITLRTADNVIVRLSYESSRWRAELTRRQKVVSEHPETPSLDETTYEPDYRRRNGEQ